MTFFPPIFRPLSEMSNFFHMQVEEFNKELFLKVNLQVYTNKEIAKIAFLFATHARVMNDLHFDICTTLQFFYSAAVISCYPIRFRNTKCLRSLSRDQAEGGSRWIVKNMRLNIPRNRKRFRIQCTCWSHFKRLEGWKVYIWNELPNTIALRNDRGRRMDGIKLTCRRGGSLHSGICSRCRHRAVVGESRKTRSRFYRTKRLLSGGNEERNGIYFSIIRLWRCKYFSSSWAMCFNDTYVYTSYIIIISLFKVKQQQYQ